MPVCDLKAMAVYLKERAHRGSLRLRCRRRIRKCGSVGPLHRTFSPVTCQRRGGSNIFSPPRGRQPVVKPGDPTTLVACRPDRYQAARPPPPDISSRIRPGLPLHTVSSSASTYLRNSWGNSASR